MPREYRRAWTGLPGARIVSFSSPQEKAEFLDAEALLDSTSASVREKARELCRGVRPGDWGACARRLFDFTRSRIAFLRDPAARGGKDTGEPERVEELADSATILRRGYDDCDGKVRTLLALVRAACPPSFGALEGRVRPVVDELNDFRHVQAILRWPGSESAGDVRHVFEGGWVPAEVILKRAQLGDLPSDVSRETGGQWLL